MSELVGRVLNRRYRVEELLGRGGMAEVYRVLDLQRMVPLAMKLLREDLAEDTVFLRRFKREAQTLAKLQHPNIVRFYGLEQEGPLAFILMDYIEGRSLRREIFDAHGPLSPQRVLEIMQPVCAALYYAHRQGFVHCDIKPGNVLMDKKGTVYLTDFGIARMTESATATMVGAGTPAYMSPEQARGEDPTPQTDIYALGIVLFEMLTGGERPFTGEHARTTGSTSEKVRWEQLHLQPPSLQKFNQALSPELEAVVLKCLEKDPDRRYDSVLTILGALEQKVEKKKSVKRAGLKRGKTADLKPPAPSPSASTFNLPAIPTPTAQDNQRKRSKRTKLRLGIVLLFILLLGGSMLLGSFPADWIYAPPSPSPSVNATSTNARTHATPNATHTSTTGRVLTAIAISAENILHTYNAVAENFRFSGLEGCWYGVENSSLINRYVSSNEYHVEFKANDALDHNECLHSIYSDYLVSMKIEVSDSSTPWWAGIVFASSNDHFSVFEVSWNKYYSVKTWSWSQSDWIEESSGQSSKINETGYNLLMVVCHEQAAYVYVNDSYVSSFAMPSGCRGSIGSWLRGDKGAHLIISEFSILVAR